MLDSIFHFQFFEIAKVEHHLNFPKLTPRTFIMHNDAGTYPPVPPPTI